MDETAPHEEHAQTAKPAPVGFWRSRAGISLLVALLLGGLLVCFEHRGHIFGSGWLLWLPLLLCVGMHFFMHGGHGGHGGKSGGSGRT